MNFINKIKRKFKSEIKFQKKGTNVIIENSSIFYSPENIIIGDNVRIGPRNRLHGYAGITISNGTILANDVNILTRNHNYDGEGLESIPYDKKYILKPVFIEENVWVGSFVLIAPGVTIGEGAVIGMGSVVTKDIPRYAVVGGNPAKVIKYRDQERYEKLKQENQIYLKKKFDL